MKNKDIADIFNRMGTLLELQGENVFKIRAYRRAADHINELAEDLDVLNKENRLSDIPGIGRALQEKIAEYLTGGRMTAYDRLISVVPESLLDIVEIPSVGPKKAKLFYEKLGVEDVAGLKQAVKDGRLTELPGIKEKTIQNIAEGILVFEAQHERMSIAQADTAAQQIIGALKALKGVNRIEAAGSLRRHKESVGDIDILVDSSRPQDVMAALVNLPQVKKVLAHGETKSSVLLSGDVQVDVRVVPTDSYGAALLYFTGSKNFNVRLRQLAMKQNKKVNEYGIFRIEKNKEIRIAGKTERECFEALDLPFIPPALREDIGERRLFTATAVNEAIRIPKVIELKDIKGDLHVHSTWSDGHVSSKEMAVAAKARGYEYIGISDHSERLKVANGLTEKDLKRKQAEIEKLNKTLKGIRVLFGTEVEILPDGSLDYNDKILREFDVVIAAVHSSFEQSRKQMTQRLIRACQNPHVHILAHPTCVHAGKRPPCNLDLQELACVAAETNTFIEINSFPVRLDLDSVNTYFCQNQGAKICINTDAHKIEHLDFMKYGIGIAQRAWLTKKQVLNTLGLKDLMKALKK